MISYENSIVVAAPASTVFAYVGDFSTHTSWFPGLAEVSDVVGSGEGQQCEWMYRMVGVPLRGQAVMVESVSNWRATFQTIGMLDAMITSIVEPCEGGTKLTFRIEYTIPLPVLGRVAENLTVRRMERDFSSALLNVKDLAEAEA